MWLLRRQKLLSPAMVRWPPQVQLAEACEQLWGQGAEQPPQRLSRTEGQAGLRRALVTASALSGISTLVRPCHYRQRESSESSKEPPAKPCKPPPHRWTTWLSSPCVCPPSHVCGIPHLSISPDNRQASEKLGPTPDSPASVGTLSGPGGAPGFSPSSAWLCS